MTYLLTFWYFKVFEKILVTLLQWFAAQQQISAFREQKYTLFHAKFNAQFNASSLVPASKNHSKWIKNHEKQTVFGKPISTLPED